MPRVIGLVAPLLFVLSCATAPSTQNPADHAVLAHHAPVLVTVIVDQFAAWVARERLPELPQGGGFARLRREGAWVTTMRYEHSVTDTAPGHSALFTGAVPRVSGIFANETLDGNRSAVSILRDTKTHLVTSDGLLDRPGSSLVALRVETLADRLRAEHPDALIIGLSLKDRGALFAAGRLPDAALWFDTTSNQFVTSTAFGGFPSWASRSGADVAHAEKRSWELVDPAWVAVHAASPDREAGEGDPGGLGTAFPHRLEAATTPSLAFRTSPFADEVLVSLGLDALDAAWKPERTTLLSLSLSPNDYIGHTFGPDSWEAWDEIYRLDALLARLLVALDTRFGAGGYAVLLTGDHGVTAMPEVGRPRRCESRAADPWDRACEPGSRVMGEELGKSLAAVARNTLGPGDWVAGVSDPYVYLSPAARAENVPRKAQLTRALVLALEADPRVARVVVVADLPASCPPFTDESIDALVCRSTARGAGDLYVVLQHGSFFDPNVVVGKGTNHGSPYLYDRTVPLLARAPGRIAAGIVSTPVVFTTFVRTASALLGISPPRDAAPGDSLAQPAL